MLRNLREKSLAIMGFIIMPILQNVQNHENLEFNSYDIKWKLSPKSSWTMKP